MLIYFEKPSLQLWESPGGGCAPCWPNLAGDEVRKFDVCLRSPPPSCPPHIRSMVRVPGAPPGPCGGGAMWPDEVRLDEGRPLPAEDDGWAIVPGDLVGLRALYNPNRKPEHGYLSLFFGSEEILFCFFFIKASIMKILNNIVGVTHCICYVIFLYSRRT